jgi:hypothetical protein
MWNIKAVYEAPVTHNRQNVLVIGYYCDSETKEIYLIAVDMRDGNFFNGLMKDFKAIDLPS